MTRTAAWAERASDWANPILVKETRQALKSRQFATTFMMLLATAWVAAVVGLVMAGSRIEYGSTGRGFFQLFYFVLSIAILWMVPFTAFRSLLTERDQNTFELLSITSLTPRQIVWGKLLSALVQVFIYYSAIAPFIAFTSLLQGFDPAQAAYLLVVLMVLSLGFSMAGLMLSTLARKQQGQAVMSMVVAWILMSGFAAFMGFVFSLEFIPFDSSDFWWANAVCLLAFLSYVVLFQQITTAQLTFESDNRSTAIRVTVALQFCGLWLAAVLYTVFRKHTFHHQLFQVLMAASMVHWSLVGLCASTEPDRLSRRVVRSLPRSRLCRLAVAPWMPGGARGLSFSLIHVALLWIASIALYPLMGRLGSITTEQYFHGLAALDMASLRFSALFATVFCSYIVVYLGLAAALGRWAQAASVDVRPSHVRVLVFLVFMAGLIAPFIPRVAGLITTERYVLWDITDPIRTWVAVSRSGGFDDSAARQIFTCLAGAAIAAVLLNVRAMWRGIAEIVSAPQVETARTVSDVSDTPPAPAELPASTTV